MTDENFEWTSEPYRRPPVAITDNPSVPPIPRKKRRRGSRGGRGRQKTIQTVASQDIKAVNSERQESQQQKRRKRGSRGGKNRAKKKAPIQELTYPSPGQGTKFNSPSTDVSKDPRPDRESISKKWAQLSGTSRRYSVAIVITTATIAISVLLRNQSETTWSLGKRAWRFETQSVLIVWSVVIVPIFSICLSSFGRRNFYTTELEDSPAFTYFRTSEKLLTILSSLLTYVLNYIVISLIAWKNVLSTPKVGEFPNHWYWLDRQTVAFVATLVVSILASMLTNASKDLSGANERARDEFISVSNKARHLLAQIHQHSEFLWDEFEESFKSGGKWFLYTANSYLKRPNNTVGKEILDYIGATLMGTTLNEEIDALISSRLSDLTIEEGFQFDWSNSQWVNYFNPRDFAELIPSQTLNLDQLLDPRKVPLTQAEHLALDIANRISVSSSDGRFCLVDSLDEKSKSFGLIFQRQANALCKNIQTSSGEKKWVYGYFPTDSSLTFELVMRMIQDSGTSTSSTAKEEYKDAFSELYQELQAFAIKNKGKLDELRDLIASLENLTSSYALPMSLLTDDAILLTSILNVGTDANFKNDTLDDQQLRTLARFLTYAASYYWGQVSNQTLDRQLPINFPSPFGQMIKESGYHRRHTARRFEELRKAIEDKLLMFSIQKGGRNQSPANRTPEDWAITLEILNSQSPIMNWIKSGHAYVTREAFLSADIESPLTVGIDESPIELAIRRKLLGVFFRSDAMEDSADNYLERQRIMSLSQRIDGTPEVLIDITNRAEDVARHLCGQDRDPTTKLPLLFGVRNINDEIIGEAAAMIVGPTRLRVEVKSQINSIVRKKKSKTDINSEPQNDR